MSLKDKDDICQKSGVISWFKCPNWDFPEEYIGESGRTIGDRLKEYLRTPSPIHQHSQTTEQPVNLECYTIVDRESQDVTRNIRKPCTSG